MRGCLLIFTLVAALNSFPHAEPAKPTLLVPRTQQSIRIDGDLSDPGWQGTARASDFTQFIPIDMVKPSVATDVFTAYDDEYLYFGFVCHDNPDDIRATLTDRDRMYNDDFVGIILDTYGDAAWAYEFYTNPLGVQGDLRWIGLGEEDSRFDVIFESAGVVTDSGWQAEMAIPFSSLRFPDREEQIWRATFWRSHPRENRQKYSWVPIPQGEPCFLCELGYLTGIRGVEPGSKLDLLPAMVASQTGSIADRDDLTSSFDNTDPDAEGELNVRYRLTPGLTAEAAVNPDFSQVESDAAQIDANTTFALYFPERRPFFQEGSDLYGTSINAIYTRAVNDPEAAFKFSGRQNRTGFFFLSAADDNSPLFIPLAEGTEFVALDKTYSNIGRVRHSLARDSYLGALFTDRRVDAGEGANTVYGVDGAWRFLPKYRFSFQVLGSRTVEPDRPDLSADYLENADTTFDDGRHTVWLDGETFDGLASYLRFDRDDRFWNFNVEYMATGPTFRAENGFVTRAGIHTANIWSGLTFRPNSRLVTRFTPSVTAGRIWDWTGGRKDEWVRAGFDVELPIQLHLNGNFLLSRELFRGIWFDDIWRVMFHWDMDTFDKVRVGGFFNYGNSIARNEDPLPVMGRELTLELWGTIKPLQQFTIEPSWMYARMRNRDTGEPIYEGYISRTRLNYQFTKELSTRFIVQYDEFADRLSFEPLVTYKINPYTIFYVGSASRYDWNDDDVVGGRLVDRQYFMKLQYLFRM